MARKKKEDIKEEQTLAPVAVETEENASAEKSDAPKKAVRRGRTPKKATEKEAPVQAAEEETSAHEKKEAQEVAKESFKAEEPKSEEKKTERPRRGRKSAKKAVEEKPIEREEEKKEERSQVKAEESAPVSIEPPKAEAKKTVTRAEKNETIKSFVKELLNERPYKWSELLDESAKLYEERIEEKDGHSANDVRGRIGSVFDVMKKDGEVVFEGGVYALKANAEKQIATIPAPVKSEQKPAETDKKEQKTPVSAEKPTSAPVELKSEKTAEVKAEKQLPAVKQKAEIAPVFDMTLLLGDKNKTEKDKNPAAQKAEKTPEAKREEKTQVKAEEKPASAPEKPVKTEKKNQDPKSEKKAESKKTTAREEKQPKRAVERRGGRTAESRLKETFLKRIRSLGGKYFEYFSIYLLERYSLRNGRRVDGFKVSGGDNDGGIDGEIEVTDRIGFKETIYIQAKNWKPIYGKEDSWVIGETTLREFIGAVAYRQAKEGKQHCRGIFITTSYFTTGSKEILEKMSDQFVGYDGDDLFECAKECSFGLVERDGQWTIDEKLLAGDKAFFNLYE